MAFGSYEVGVIQRTPLPDLTTEEAIRLAELVRDAVGLKIDLDSSDETVHHFSFPALLSRRGVTLAERFKDDQKTLTELTRRQADIQSEIEGVVYRMYGIDDQDRRAIESAVANSSNSYDAASQDGDRL